MPARQTGPELCRKAIPLLWLLSDARNDMVLEAALAALPRPSGFVFRHYHLGQDARAERFRRLAAAARGAGHVVVLADKADIAETWGADGIYGHPDRIGRARGLLKLATAHDGDELSAAGRAGADGVFLSPVFATRSHPGTQPLGIHGFHVLAQQSPVPVIALGGMTKARAAQLNWPRWGAIDGLGASPS
jgi:thiamine-phosphate pyrophosphorylase